MSSIVVYTCILDAFDVLRPPEVIEPGVRYIAFVDGPQPSCPPWEFQPAYTPFASASRNSRIPKILPHLHFEADYSIWHDGCFRLNAMPSEIIPEHLKEADIAMYAHPARQTVEQECRVLLNECIGSPDQVGEQWTRWQDAGRPPGLWCGGFIVRRHSNEIERLNIRWWHEYINGSTRDQIAFPVARHLTKMYVQSIPGTYTDGVLLKFQWHCAFKAFADDPENLRALAAMDRTRTLRRELERHIPYRRSDDWL